MVKMFMIPPPHEMLGRSEGKPSKVIYNVPFLVWQSPEWLSTHQFDLNDKNNPTIQ